MNIQIKKYKKYHSYCDQELRVDKNTTIEEITDFINFWFEKTSEVNLHCIGQRAIHNALEATIYVNRMGINFCDENFKILVSPDFWSSALRNNTMELTLNKILI